MGCVISVEQCHKHGQLHHKRRAWGKSDCDYDEMTGQGAVSSDGALAIMHRRLRTTR